MKSLLIALLITLQVNGQTSLPKEVKKGLEGNLQDWIAWDVSDSYPTLKSKIFSLNNVKNRGVSKIFYQEKKTGDWNELEASEKSLNQFLRDSGIVLQKKNATEFAELFGKVKFGKSAILIDSKSLTRYRIDQRKVMPLAFLDGQIIFDTISSAGEIYRTECRFKVSEIGKIVSKRTHKKISILMPPGS